MLHPPIPEVLEQSTLKIHPGPGQIVIKNLRRNQHPAVIPDQLTAGPQQAAAGRHPAVLLKAGLLQIQGVHHQADQSEAGPGPQVPVVHQVPFEAGQVPAGPLPAGPPQAVPAVDLQEGVQAVQAVKRGNKK